RPPPSSMSMARALSRRRRAARAYAAATADLPTPPLPETRTSRLLTSSVGTERDAENQVIVFHRPLGGGDEGEVGEVDLLLLQEHPPLRPGHRRQRPVLHGFGPLREAGDHRIDVELSHPTNPVRSVVYTYHGPRRLPESRPPPITVARVSEYSNHAQTQRLHTHLLISTDRLRDHDSTPLTGTGLDR